jgi:outer membrane receptor protein involved in Fe transport
MSRALHPRSFLLIALATAAVAVIPVAHAQPDGVPPPPDEPAVRADDLASGVRGRIVDSDSGEPISDVVVTVVGQPVRAISDDDGVYQLALPRGTYTLRYAGDLYQRQRVRGVVVRAGGITTVDLRLTEDEIDEVVVVVPPDTGSDAVQVVRRRRRATVSDAISAEQIQRSADSNASDAAKRMVGATIQDNRYVVLRGLGGRYSLTLLNGVPLPSPDPDVPAAPLDLFPAGLLANLTVTKTFSPDMPGNFAGGALSIETRSFPARFTLKVKGGLSASSAGSFRSVNGYDGGGLDVLGFDDGTRALPDAIPATQLAGDPSLSAAELRAQVTSFSDGWTLEPRRAAPNGSLSVTAGDTLHAGKQQLGYFASASYSHGYGRRRTHLARVGEADPDGDGYLPSVLQLDEQQGLESASVGGLLTAGWTPSPAHGLNVIGLYAHNADDTGSQVTGTDNNTATIDRSRLRFVARQLAFTQLVGESALAGGKVILGWQANLARVGQHEPDTRDLLRSQIPDGRWVISRSSGSSERLFADLGDTTGGGGLDVTVPFERFKLKAGGSYLRSHRAYQARRFHFDVSGSMELAPVAEAFSPANELLSFYEATLPTDGYTATRAVTAGYLLADVALGDELRLVGGARYERATLDLTVESEIDLMAPPTEAARRDDRDLLPAVNAVYALGRTMNLRAAYAQTVARANFREIAPALYYDFVRRRAIGGNPDLSETRIHNADLRWEAYLGDGDLLAASLFYKRFVSPIEATIEDAGSGENVGFSNAARATSYGLELEARTGLGRIHPALAPFSIAGNVSLIGSAIDDGGAGRPLQGQSPYVVNVDLGYAHAQQGTTIDLLYNAAGRRIEEVGTGGAGNVYEEPVHRLDLSLGQRLTRDLKLKISATNLLARRAVRSQNGVEILAYPIGVAVLASVEFSVD